MVDAVLFFVGGVVSDRFGRRFAAIPTSLNMGVSFIALAFCTSTISLFAVATLFGVADALGAGLLLSLMGDHVPKKASGRFVGLLRFMLDSGQCIGPLIVAGLTTFLPFHVTCWSVGALGLFNSWWAWHFLPRDCPKAPQLDESSALLLGSPNSTNPTIQQDVSSPSAVTRDEPISSITAIHQDDQENTDK
jgi:MFS family permease